MSHASRIASKNSTVSLDEEGKPLFGTVRTTTRTPTKKEERRETAKREYPTREEHIAYLKLIGYDPFFIPGTPQYIAAIEGWIERARPMTPAEHRQLEHWREELKLCQAMRPSSSPANSAVTPN